MRKLVSTIALTSVLVLGVSSVPLAVLAQRKAAKTSRTAPASLASQRGADAITAAQMKDYLSFIASDLMEGRDTPSRGLDITAQFLATQLSRWGFKPAGDDGSYFQKIALGKDTTEKAETRVLLNAQPLII